MSSQKRFGLFAAAFLAAAFVILGAGIPGRVSAQDPSLRVLGPGSLEDRPGIDLLASGPGGLEMEFTLPSLALEDVELEGRSYQILAIPGGGQTGETGHPMLPTYGQLIAVPNRAGVRISAVVEEEEEYDDVRPLPVQEESGPTFAFDAAAYARDSFGDAPAAEVGEPAILRDVRLVPVSFHPVRCNPAQAKIRVARRVRVEVSFVGEDLTNARMPDDRPIAPSFDRLYRALLPNYESIAGERATQPGSWLIICPNNSTVVNLLQPLVNWRNRKGNPATLVTTAETGTSRTTIKAYIQNVYNTSSPRLEYVVLAGDGDGSYSLPVWYESLSGENGYGDHPYTELEGGDILPDIHIGRLSFSSTAELEAIVNKIVGYESTPYISDADWFTRACLVGDPYDSGYSTVMVMQCLKTRLLQLGYTQIDTVFSGSFVSQMTTALNRGDTIFAYRGFYAMSGWTNSNTYALTNGWKMPFAMMCTCGTGSFVGGTARSEAFLRANNGVNNPKAAVGAIGTCTLGTHTRFNNCYTYGVMGGLAWEDLWAMGAATSRGKVELYRCYFNSAQSNYATIFSYWNNLMGDPACEVWTAFPQPLTVNHSASLPVGANSMTVYVHEGANPAVGARVCAWKGSETYQVGLTDAQGRIDLPLSLSTSGDLLLTVTKHDRQPYLATIPVSVYPRFIAYLSNAVNDDGSGQSQGNGDGQINPGETIELGLQLKNFGSSAVGGITAYLSSQDPYLVVSSGVSSYPDLNPGQTAWGDADYLFSVEAGCPHGHELLLNLLVVAGADQWFSQLRLPAVSADLGAVLSVQFLDGGNGVLDPGETAQMIVDLQNSGGLSAVAPQAVLYSQGEFVDVPFPSASFPTIGPGGHAQNGSFPFTVHAAPGTFRGYLAHMRMVLQFTGGLRDTCDFAFTVGQRSNADPLGPDAYGYWAFDNTDTAYPAYVPSYSWIELDPSYGGSGATEIVLGDYNDYQDKSTLVSLPFNFKYYGTNYDRATVCSNGWIQMGSTYLTNYRNWSLPSLGGPNGTIAVFWDDLYQSSSSSRAFHKYDAANHTWTVEWSRFRNDVGSYTETFEAIFYDPVYHPTDTGDGIIQFQYNTVSNPDGTDGYATVGIESPDNGTGIEYTYFNRYPIGAPALTAGRAIRFVPRADTPPSAGVETAAAPAFGLAAQIPNPMRPGSWLRFALDSQGPAGLRIYDVRGRLVRRLFEGPAAPGPHAVLWNGRDEQGRLLPSGVYLYRLTAGDREQIRKGLLVR